MPIIDGAGRLLWFSVCAEIMKRAGSGQVLTRFGGLDRLPASLDTPLMPGRRVRSRPCGPLTRVKVFCNICHYFEDTPRVDL